LDNYLYFSKKENLLQGLMGPIRITFWNTRRILNSSRTMLSSNEQIARPRQTEIK